MSTLEDFLTSVRNKPGMYIQDHSLFQLELMLDGYSVALHTHEIQEIGRDFNRCFSDFVYERQGWPGAAGWAHAITENCAGPDEAFDTFFELVAEFRQETSERA